jgi:hypothetical protein
VGVARGDVCVASLRRRGYSVICESESKFQ